MSVLGHPTGPAQHQEHGLPSSIAQQGSLKLCTIQKRVTSVLHLPASCCVTCVVLESMTTWFWLFQAGPGGRAGSSAPAFSHAELIKATRYLEGASQSFLGSPCSYFLLSTTSIPFTPLFGTCLCL